MTNATDHRLTDMDGKPLESTRFTAVTIPATRAPSGVVVVYTVPTGCVQCRFTKARLEANGIPYIEIDLAANEDARAWWKEEHHVLKAPIVVAGHGWWTGFDPDKIDDLAKRAQAANDNWPDNEAEAA